MESTAILATARRKIPQYLKGCPALRKSKISFIYPTIFRGTLADNHCPRTQHYSTFCIERPRELQKIIISLGKGSEWSVSHSHGSILRCKKLRYLLDTYLNGPRNHVRCGGEERNFCPHREPNFDFSTKRQPFRPSDSVNLNLTTNAISNLEITKLAYLN